MKLTVPQPITLASELMVSPSPSSREVRVVEMPPVKPQPHNPVLRKKPQLSLLFPGSFFMIQHNPTDSVSVLSGWLPCALF